MTHVEDIRRDIGVENFLFWNEGVGNRFEGGGFETKVFSSDVFFFRKRCQCTLFQRRVIFFFQSTDPCTSPSNLFTNCDLN